jgi:hypothetical protein
VDLNVASSAAGIPGTEPRQRLRPGRCFLSRRDTSPPILSRLWIARTPYPAHQFSAPCVASSDHFPVVATTTALSKPVVLRRLSNPAPDPRRFQPPPAARRSFGRPGTMERVPATPFVTTAAPVGARMNHTRPGRPSSADLLKASMSRTRMVRFSGSTAPASLSCAKARSGPGSRTRRGPHAQLFDALVYEVGPAGTSVRPRSARRAL